MLVRISIMLILLLDAHSLYARIAKIEPYQGNQRRVVSFLKKIEKRNEIIKKHGDLHYETTAR